MPTTHFLLCGLVPNGPQISTGPQCGVWEPCSRYLRAPQLLTSLVFPYPRYLILVIQSSALDTCAIQIPFPGDSLPAFLPQTKCMFPPLAPVPHTQPFSSIFMNYAGSPYPFLHSPTLCSLASLRPGIASSYQRHQDKSTVLGET